VTLEIVAPTRIAWTGLFDGKMLGPAEPLNLQVDPNLATPHLNVLIPGLAMRCMSGGPNTALNLTYRMAAQGVPVRYIATGVPPDSDHGPLWQHILDLSGISQRLPHVEITTAHDRSQTFSIGPRDVFFATAWWTAQMVKYALPLVEPKQFIYLIQDYEPGLHEWSTYHSLALETYALNYRPIVNHPFLLDYLRSHNVARFADPAFVDNCVVLDPAVDRSFFYYESHRNKPLRRLLLYARPSSASRNMFQLAVAALQTACREGAFEDEPWEFVGMGDPFDPIPLDGKHTLVPTAWKNLDEYAQQMRQSDILLSLMLSPHPSYPPLEMAACGGLVVTNSYDCKTADRLAQISENIIAADCTVESLAAALRDAGQRVGDHEARERFSKLSLPSNWHESFVKVLPQAMHAWTSCLGPRHEKGGAFARRIYHPAHRQEKCAKEARIAELHRQLQANESHAAHLKAQVDSLDAQVRSADAQIHNLNALVHILEKEVRELKMLSQQRQALIDQLEKCRQSEQTDGWRLQAIAASQEQQIQEIMASFSWRCTGPIRVGGRLIRSLFDAALRRKG
jgi:beta-1,2-rhamnosyltransferase WsaF-like protein